MHNFLPLHGFTPSCQRSPWNSTKKKTTLTDKIVFPPSALTPRVRGSTKVFFTPASFHVATFSSLQDTLPQTLPSSPLPHPLPSYSWYDSQRVLEECLKTRRRQKRLQASSDCHRWAASSSFRKFPRSAFLHRRKLPVFMVGGTWRDKTCSETV